ncbi:MAG: NnrU family protein [Kordiimonadaceae bacterium]|jgi:uncharacterized membrane protein|nr:NnrU family protein [Kordiimonadaceae bacterium]MBT6031879.1 NnrU family protein [Kordiimonadaceae bacterium]MBT6328334.1 NnrU family protein [Kordiimonadaceae bacterium]MBT7582829.1 NnrU family protein [Kordiimonadaceae bacterium]
MDMLLAGLFLWAGVHYIPGLMPNVKEKLVATLGGAYRPVFALAIISSILLIVFGWKSTSPEFIYEPLSDASQVTGVLMIICFYLLGAANGPSNAKRFIRHPMLSGVIVWGGAHLLANGDSRSVILFGGMIIWATTEILVINKREGAYEKPEPVPMNKDIIKLLVAIVIYGVVVFAHPYIAGVPVMSL